MMAKLTRVPEILTELTSLIGAQPEIDARALIFGGKTANEYMDYILFVGFSVVADEWVISERAAPKGLAANDAETVTVGMFIAATNGESDMVAAIARAGEIVHVVERVVTDQPTLGLGKGVTATIGNTAWRPAHTSKGAECNVTFDVNVKVLL